MKEKVILVNKADHEIGEAEKMKVHKEGLLHRAFSVFIFNSRDQLLLQRRSKTKYHSPSLWSNTCCSHPRPSENILEAAHRRLKGEMGFDCDIRKDFSFIYKVQFDGGLFEHEYDHVFVGTCDKEPVPNPEEVDECKWVSMDRLKRDIRNNPEHYTYWFKKAVGRIASHPANY